MSPQEWEPTPAFSYGQPFSAGAHGAAIERALGLLHDDLLGAQMPFNGVSYGDPSNFLYHYQGSVRHKTNSLEWKYEITGGGSAYITVNGATLSGTSYSGNGIYSGTADLSGLGIAVNQFYTVTVECGSGIRVWLIRETQTLSYPTLAAFTEESTPTAAEWQGVSDYAELLNRDLSNPYAPVNRTGGILGTLFTGTMHHSCRYLDMEIKVKSPYHRSDYEGTPESDTGSRWTKVWVYLNGTEAALLYVGREDGWSPPAPPEYSEGYFTGPAGTHQFWVRIDLEDCGVSLVYGEDYTIRIEVDRSTFWDLYGDAKLYSIGEVPEDIPELDGWTAPPHWAHGDYIHGSSGSKRIQTWKADLELLQAAVTYHNYPCPVNRIWNNWSFFMRRRYRWLHYLGRVDEEGHTQGAKIGYNLAGFTREVSLPDAGDGWKVFDLDSLEGLWVGYPYLIAGVYYAIEDAST